MFYVPVLFLHSWMRWLVLILCFLSLLGALRGVITGRAAGRIEQRLGWLMVLCVDLQLLLGLLLFVWLSPLPAAAFSDLRAAMKIAPLRFFSIEHGSTMLLFVVGVHLTRVLARRRKTPRGRYGVTAIGLLLSVVLALVAIPWPGRSYGRPYLRTQRYDRTPGSAFLVSAVGKGERRPPLRGPQDTQSAGSLAVSPTLEKHLSQQSDQNRTLSICSARESLLSCV